TQPAEYDEQPQPAAEQHHHHGPTTALGRLIVLALLTRLFGRGRGRQSALAHQHFVMRFPGGDGTGSLLEFVGQLQGAPRTRDGERVPRLGDGEREVALRAGHVLRHGSTRGVGELLLLFRSGRTHARSASGDCYSIASPRTATGVQMLDYPWIAGEKRGDGK